MKRNILLMMLLASYIPFSFLRAQTIHNNSVKKIIPREARTYMPEYTVDNSITSLQYFDALGRSMQTIQVGISPDKRDMVTCQEFDASGRKSSAWLPVKAAVNNNGQPLTLGTIQSLSSSLYGDSKAYSKPVYEDSPLNRVLEQYGPGQDWHNNNKRVKTENLTNAASGDLSCRWYRTTDNRNDAQVSIQSGKENYPAYELYVTRTTDEDGQGITLEFKNKQGQLLLVRRMNGTIKHDTYYVYDSYGNLRVVLPPLAADALTTTSSWTPATDGTDVLSRYAYLYKCDERKRCIGKKLPGMGWIKYNYDRADRLITTLDAEQAAKTPAECTFYMYDESSRLVLQGTSVYTNSIVYTSSSLVTTSLYYSSDGSITPGGIGGSGYRNNCQLVSPIVHTVNYYDHYRFRTLEGFKNNSNFPAETYPGKGMLTATVTTLLDGSYTKKLYTAYYYDVKGRLAKTVSSNHLGGYDITTNTYTFTDKPSTVTHVHTATGQAQQTQIYTYTYDHAERLKTVTHKLNTGTTVTLVNNTYDDLGRLKKNTRNGISNIYDEYSYDVRSRLTRIYGIQLAEDLTYNYNGNISSMQWKVDGRTYKHTYTYDPLSRLTATAYTGIGNYATSYSYDKHGNITALQRYGNTVKSDLGIYSLADNLKMSYTGNQLVNVEDAAVSVTLPESNDFKKGSAANPGYTYDKNGNLTKDLNKKLTAVSYNSLYLPQQLTIDNVMHTYTYAADGRKLKVVQGSMTRDYVGSLIYENSSLKRILFDGGYIEDGIYNFYITDHLGNVRVVAAGGNTYQCNDYYPFGLPMAETSDRDQNKQPYKYNGKEFERKNGLNWLDYGARHYDPALCRFTTMDPLAERYYDVSPYAYCGNNPLSRIDPDGLAWKPTFDEDHNGVRIYNGYEWIPTEEAYIDGVLKKGLYEQAIFFSDNGNYNSLSKYNMGSSTATVYLADGTTEAFDANTNPSTSDYATVPEGIYHATVGKHKGAYTALRMSDVNDSGKIELGGSNPAHPEKTYAEGINIHLPGTNNLTGKAKDGRAISQGCLLIDINNWNNFIGNFNTKEQRSNKVSVTVSRNMSNPVNANRLPAFNFIMNGSRRDFFSPKFK